MGNKGRQTAEANCGATAVVASHKASFNQPPSHSLSRWAVLIKTTAMAGILLVGAHGKHHKIIKSKVTLYPHWMSTSLRNKNPPVWCQWRRYGRTLVGWSNGDGEALALQDEWAASSAAAQTQVFFCLVFFCCNFGANVRAEFLRDMHLHTQAPKILTSLSCGGSW